MIAGIEDRHDGAVKKVLMLFYKKKASRQKTLTVLADKPDEWLYEECRWDGYPPAF